MVLPHARNSTIETFNRLSSPFSDQSDLYLWDAEIPPHADLSGQTAGADGESATSRGPIADVSSKPPAAAVQQPCMTFGAASTATYEPFIDPLQNWAWAPPAQVKADDAGLPPLVGSRAWQPVPAHQQMDETAAAADSWRPYIQSSDAAKIDDFAPAAYETPDETPRFSAATITHHLPAMQTYAYDSDSSAHSDVWSAGSSSEDEHNRTPDPAAAAAYPQKETAPCKPCTTTARRTKATKPAATPPTLGAEQAQPCPCPFCTGNEDEDEDVCDGRKTRKRRRKAVSRTTQRHGRWWQTLGYGGPAYCQRCSEVFRDHIIRQKPNSAECNRSNPCDECAKVLNHFSAGTGEHTMLWEKIDARGYAKVRRRGVGKSPRDSAAQAQPQQQPAGSQLLAV